MTPQCLQKLLAFENPGQGLTWRRQEPSYGLGLLPSLQWAGNPVNLHHFPDTVDLGAKKY